MKLATFYRTFQETDEFRKELAIEWWNYKHSMFSNMGEMTAFDFKP